MPPAPSSVPPGRYPAGPQRPRLALLVLAGVVGGVLLVGHAIDPPAGSRGLGGAPSYTCSTAPCTNAP